MTLFDAKAELEAGVVAPCIERTVDGDEAAAELACAKTLGNVR